MKEPLNVYSSDESGDERVKPLSTCTRLSFAFGNSGHGMVQTIVNIFLTPFLLNVVGLSAGFVGTLILIGRFWDAISDPIVGYFSDKTVSKWGRRRPWILASALPYSVFYFFLWQDFSFSSTTMKFIYYLTIFCGLYTSMTCYFVPYSALTLEMSNSVHERNKLVQYQYLVNCVFTLAGSVGVSALIDHFDHHSDRGYKISAAVASTIVLTSILITFATVRERPRHLLGKQSKMKFFEGLKEAFRFGPYVYVVFYNFFATAGASMTQVLLVLYVINSVNLDAQLPIVLTVVGVSIFCFMAFAGKLIAAIGKKSYGFLSNVLLILGCTWFYFLPRHSLLFYPAAVLTYSGLAGTVITPACMLPDVVDLETVDTGLVREGVFYSYFLFLQKLGVGTAMFIANYGLEIGGYISGSSPDLQPDTVDLTIRLLIGPAAILLVVASWIFLRAYPLTTDAIEQNVRILTERRKESLEIEPDPVTTEPDHLQILAPVPHGKNDTPSIVQRKYWEAYRSSCDEYQSSDSRVGLVETLTSESEQSERGSLASKQSAKNYRTFVFSDSSMSSIQ